MNYNKSEFQVVEESDALVQETMTRWGLWWWMKLGL
jgi:hypothetical protein